MLHRHTPALDGVRGIAILVVFGVHTHPVVFRGGHIGVDLFFVLSGFLISSILLTEQSRTGRIRFFNFYMRRALRLLPALFAMVVLVCIYAVIFEPEEVRNTLLDAQAILLYYYNWWILVDEHIRPSPHQRYFRHLWSLSIEEQFYIVWPLLMFVLLVAMKSQRAMLAVLLAGLIGPAVARVLLWESGPSLWLYFRTDLRFDLLMWGALGAWLVHGERLPSVSTHAGRVMVRGAPVALAIFFLIALFPVLKSGFLYVGGYSLVGFLSAWFIVVAAVGPPRRMARFLELRFLRWTGKISYGLYIWHIPIFWSVFKLDLPDIVETMIGITLTYAVAALSFRYWETPFLRRKKRYGPGTDAHLASDSAPNNG